MCGGGGERTAQMPSGLYDENEHKTQILYMYIGLWQGLVAKYALLCTFVWAGGHNYWYY